MSEQNVTYNDFFTLLKAVAELAKETEDKIKISSAELNINSKELDNKVSELETECKKSLQDINNGVYTTKKELQEKINDLNEKMQKLFIKVSNYVLLNGKDGVDGKDAEQVDIENLIQQVLNRIPLVEPQINTETKIEYIENDGDDIIDKINDTNGDNKIDASRIKNLPKLLKFIGGSRGSTLTNISSSTTDLTIVNSTTTPVLTVVSAPKLTTARNINGVAFDGTTNITITDSTKEPVVTVGTVSQYYRGDKTFQILDKTSVGLNNVDNTSDVNKPISNATQIALNLKTNNTRLISTVSPLAGGGDLLTDRILTTSMSTNKLIGRTSAGTGVMEEITLGTNLSFTGNTLNASGGSGGADPLTEFDYLVIKFTTSPTLNAIIATGKVFNYILNGVTRYRFVPTIYNPAQDAFYLTFTGGTLSNLITTRG